MKQDQDELAEDIVRVGKLLSDPERWTPDEIAVGSTGRPCRPLAVRARKWSVAGAVAKVCNWNLDDDPAANDFAKVYGHISLVAQGRHKKSVERVEQELGHAAVLEMLRHAYRTASYAG